MKTFWITDAGSMATDVPADWRGTLADWGLWWKAANSPIDSVAYLPISFFVV
jgi:hypothetical protein